MSDVVLSIEDYSLNNSSKVVNLLETEMSKMLRRTRIESICIVGKDFNDEGIVCMTDIEVRDHKVSIIDKISENVIKYEPFEGNYWWEDTAVVVNLINKFIKETLSLFKIDSINIFGTDFSDGRERHRIEISVSSKMITIKKSGGA